MVRETEPVTQDSVQAIPALSWKVFILTMFKYYLYLIILEHLPAPYQRKELTQKNKSDQKKKKMPRSTPKFQSEQEEF